MNELNIDIKKYRNLIGKNTQIHKVSYFFKDNLKNIDKKTVLIVDFEFSKNHNINEITIIKIKNRKITSIWFEEFKLPLNDQIFSFETNFYKNITKKFNEGKNDFTDEVKNKLLNEVDKCDFFVAHNYVAELQCLFKLIYPNEKYDVNKLEVFTKNKVICTNKSFNNKYFKSSGFFKNGFKNDDVSKSLGWEVNYIDEKDKYFNIKNKELGINFNITKLPINFLNSKTNIGLHNSLFDTIVTLTNYMSLKTL